MEQVSGRTVAQGSWWEVWDSLRQTAFLDIKIIYIYKRKKIVQLTRNIY